LCSHFPHLAHFVASILILRRENLSPTFWKAGMGQRYFQKARLSLRAKASEIPTAYERRLRQPSRA
jgi:hypothetical protein